LQTATVHLLTNFTLYTPAIKLHQHSTEEVKANTCVHQQEPM